MHDVKLRQVKLVKGQDGLSLKLLYDRYLNELKKQNPMKMLENRYILGWKLQMQIIYKSQIIVYLEPVKDQVPVKDLQGHLLQ